MPEFTVSVTTSECDDGEEPYTYLVRAASMDDAVSRAIEEYAADQERDVADIRPVYGDEYTFAGRPDVDAQYTWDDLT